MPEDKERKFAKDFLEKWSRAEREEGPADEALKEVDRALAQRPDDPGLWFRRGSLLTDLERWGEALESFRKVEALDRTFPRLYVGLSFVLTRLGRAEEAAAAQRLAMEAETGERGAALEPEAEIERTLEGLAEDLAKEEREEEAVRGLAELEGIAEEPEARAAPPREAPEEDEFRGQLARWEAEGYDVAPLRDVMEKEPDRTRTAFFQFEQNVRKVQVLRDAVDALDPAGLEEDIARVRGLFRAPYQIWRIEAEMATLMEEADARDRVRRAARVTRAMPPVGRINGLAGPSGRVNGQTGRVNGQVGRVNGQTGRVNGLVNGVRRARAGLTNGLTNGLGFTNGLGGPRFALEARARRSRLLLIPSVAVILLSIVLILPPEEPPLRGGIPIDGVFTEWEGIPGYVQTPVLPNPNAAIVEYRAFFQDDRLSLYARVAGTELFNDTRGLDVLYAFVDYDGDPRTGYDEDAVGAEALVEIQGGNGSVWEASAYSWTPTTADRGDWSGWARGGPSVAAQARGPEVEVQLDMTGAAGFDATAAAVLLALDDQDGSRSETFAFGPSYGILEVFAAPAAATVSGIDAPLVRLTLRAVGGTVNVSGATFETDPLSVSVESMGPILVSPAAPRTVVLRTDASGFAAQTLINATLVAVSGDRPVTIRGGVARAYVAEVPAGHVVDGLFSDWSGNVTDPDAVSNPNVDLEAYAGEAPTATAYGYVRVRGTALGGGSAAWVRTRPSPGPASASGPSGPPERRGGEDTFRIYYDSNATASGLSVGGIVADAYLEVVGRRGLVRAARSFAWQDGWVPRGTVRAAAFGSELETSLELPGVDLRGASFVIDARDWRGVQDRTSVGGVRGTRSGSTGTTFVGSYTATLPGVADGWIRFAAQGLGVEWQLPRLEASGSAGLRTVATPAAVALDVSGFSGTFREAYPRGTAEYSAEPARFKETFRFDALPDLALGEDLVLESAVRLDAGLMVHASGEPVDGGTLVAGDLAFVDGRGLAVTFATPWIEDAGGIRADLRFWFGDGTLRIRVPGEWLRSAALPVTLDPTATYTLRNDGPGYKKGENQGYSVAVGDFNGDGYADVLAGAPQNSLGGTTHGYAYIYFGPFSADRTAPDVSINGTTASVQFGWAVTAGKFNNDAFWDALVARRSVGPNSGNVDIYFGSSSFDTAPDVQIEPPASPQSFGFAVAAGNLDNANYDDVVIGEPGRDNNGDSLADGVAYVYKSPFSATVSSANYTLFPSSNATGQLGQAIAIGEVDTDAYADVVVGEPLANSNNGRVHFYKGSSLVSGSGNRYPNATLSNQASGERFGTAVAVGSLDGNAYDDVVVGGPFRDTPTLNGAVYIFLANVDGSGLTTGASPNVTIAYQSTGERFGSAVAVLDFDDDGTAGVAVGAPFANAGGTRRGSVYWFDSPLADQTVDETMSGTQTDERFGHSLAAGKSSSDAHTLLALGAYLWDKPGGASTDNDGRAVVASIPEPFDALVALGAVLGIAAVSLQRRRLVRKR